MKLLENGDWIKDDGTIVTKEEIVKLYKKAPRSAQSLETEESDKGKQLQEGQSSGPMRLED